MRFTTVQRGVGGMGSGPGLDSGSGDVCDESLTETRWLASGLKPDRSPITGGGPPGEPASADAAYSSRSESICSANQSAQSVYKIFGGTSRSGLSRSQQPIPSNFPDFENTKQK